MSGSGADADDALRMLFVTVDIDVDGVENVAVIIVDDGISIV